MLSILKGADEKDVGVWIRLTIDGLGTLDFHRQGSSVVERKLLIWHIQSVIDDRIQAIRKASYSIGWRDAKNKKVAKRTWFSSTPEPLSWEKDYL